MTGLLWNENCVCNKVLSRSVGRPGGGCVSSSLQRPEAVQLPARKMHEPIQKHLHTLNAPPTMAQFRILNPGRVWVAEGALEACPRSRFITFWYIKSSSTLAPTFAHAPSTSRKHTRPKCSSTRGEARQLVSIGVFEAA